MRDSNGNALFLILIAVALFAALSYAVTNSGRGGGGIDRETAALHAAEIMNYTAMLSQTVQRMKLINGTPDNELDFDSSQRLRKNGAAYPHNNTVCATTDCEIFSPDGGGMTYQDFSRISAEAVPAYQDTWEGLGHWTVNIINFEGQGSALPDLAFRLSNMDPEICAEINRQMGVEPNPTITTTGETVYHMRNDPTTALAASDALTFNDDDPDLNGATTFCADSTYGWSLYSLIYTR